MPTFGEQGLVCLLIGGIDSHVNDRVRSHLVKRHKLKGRGTRQFSTVTVLGLGELGVLSLGTSSA